MGENTHHAQRPGSVPHPRRRRTLTAVLGGTILVFALVGFIFVLVTVSRLVYKGVKSYLGPAETPSFYASYIAPITALNPEPFDSIAQADRDWMLKTAVWATAKAGTGGGSYNLDEQGNVVVPAADVKTNFENFFGKTIPPQFHSIAENGIAFEYNAKAAAFHVPTTSLYSQYTPKVSKIQRHGDNVILTVQYMPASAGTGSSSNQAATPTAPVQTMWYVLHGSRGRYAVTAVLPTSSPSSSPEDSGASMASSGASSAVSGAG